MVRRTSRKTRKSVRAVRNRVLGISRLSPYGFGQAFGLVSLIAMLFYAVMYWFGGYNADIIINQFPLGFSFDNWTILLGLVQTYVLGYIGGWIFARLYNRYAR